MAEYIILVFRLSYCISLRFTDLYLKIDKVVVEPVEQHMSKVLQNDKSAGNYKMVKPKCV